MRNRKLASACAAALAAASVAACGSDSSGGGAGRSTAAAGLRGDPVVIGVINDATRPDGLTAPQIPGAAQARVDAINAAGGIQRRPLELIACDTKGDPNTATACAREMVDKDAVAVVGMTTIFEAQMIPVLEQAGIASIGTLPNSSVSLRSRISFSFTTGIIGTFSAGPKILGQVAGVRRPSLIYPSNVPRTSAVLARLFETAASEEGLGAGPIAGYTLGTTNFNASAVKGTSDGTDGTFAFGAGSGQGPLIKAVQQQDDEIPIATVAETLDRPTLEFLGPAAEGVLAVGMLQPATSDVPGIDTFNADMDAYAAEDIVRSETAINSWAGTWVFERVAADLATIDRRSVLQATGELRDLDMGDVIPPLTTTRKATDYPGMDRIFNATVIFLRIEDGALAAIDGEFVDPFPRSAP